MSVTQQIHWIQSEAFIAETYVSTMSLPKLCAILLVGPTALAGRLSGLVTYDTVLVRSPYIAACVDVSRTVFRDRSVVSSLDCHFKT